MFRLVGLPKAIQSLNKMLSLDFFSLKLQASEGLQCEQSSSEILFKQGIRYMERGVCSGVFQQNTC